MPKVAFISDEALNDLFESFGIDTFIPDEKNEPKTLLEEIVKKGYNIIYIFEKFAYAIMNTIEAIRKEGSISIVILPDHLSDLGLGLALTKQATIDAVGSDAIFAKEGK